MEVKTIRSDKKEVCEFCSRPATYVSQATIGPAAAGRAIPHCQGCRNEARERAENEYWKQF